MKKGALTNREKKQIETETQSVENQKVLTFVESIRELFKLLWWKITPNKWVGKRIFIFGKMRTVTGETYSYILVKGLSSPIRKNSRYFTRKPH